MFYVGQKVVCIAGPSKEAARQWLRRGGVYPTKGSVYTIRAINIWPEPRGELLRLVEIDNSQFEGVLCAIEPGFPSDGFRPLVNTDISVFTAMLNTIPKRVSEPSP